MKIDATVGSICYVVTISAIVSLMQALPNFLAAVDHLGIVGFFRVIPSLSVCVASAAVHTYADLHVIHRQAREARITHPSTQA